MNNGRPPPPLPGPGEHRGRERGHDLHQGHNHQHHGAPPHNQRGGHGDRHHPGHGHHQAPSQQPAPQHHPPPAKYHSYKVLIDPMIHRVSEKEKQTRFDGVTVPGNPHHLSPTPSDPRKKPLPSLWRRMEPLELPVPRMVIDEHYVGDPPKVEVTMDNLNDNINQDFLSNRIGKYGEWELLHIEYHPFSKKHLGLARIVFKQVQAAKDCVTGLHGKSIMGKLVNCYLDPRFLMAKKMFEELTTDKKPSPIPEPEPENEEPSKDELKNDYNNIGDDYDTYNENKRWDRNDGWENSENKDRNNHYNDEWRNDERRHPRHRRYDGDDYEYDRDRDRDRGGRHRDRGERERPSRWDKEDRSERGGEVRYGRGREERGGRKERRSRWDRDTRGSRDGEREERHEREREETREADLEREDRRYGGDRDRQPAETKVNPDFWAEAAAKFAARSDFLDDSNQLGDDALEAVTEGEGGDEDSRNLDLDTRLKMLMKNKDANMPAFLIPSDSSDEDPAQPSAPPVPVEDTRPLSRAPSPFLSHEAYLASHRDTLALDNMDKVNSALAGVNMGRADDDKMSLSPLSEGGDLAELPGHNQTAQFPGQPGYWPGYYAGAGGYYAQGEHQHDQWGGQYPHYGWGDTGGYNYNQYSEEQERRDRAKQKYQGKNPLKVIIDNVLGIVEAELKQILKKDISKRVCETYAFLLFDNWWTEQEARHKEKQERDLLRLKRSEPVPAIIPDKEKLAELPRIPKPEDLSSLIDKRRANLDNKGAKGGSLGMGFRGTIPKLATIQRKPRSPSPKPESSKSKSEKPKSPKKKDKHKDREKEKEKQQDKEEKTEKTSSSKSIFKEIYSDSESEKVDSSDSSSEVESEVSDDSDSDTDSDSDDESDSKVSSKSVSRSSSQSKSRSRSRSKSESRSESVTKPSTPVSRSASASPTPTSPKASVSPRRSALATKLPDSSTDSADEGPEAAVSEQGTPSTPVKVTHVTSSPPHITDHCYASMDHCYAAPPQPSSKFSETDSDNEIIEVEGGGGGDHDYTTPRTPPKAAPVTALAAVRPKVKKVAAVRPSLPVKPVKWKQRDYNEKFQIIYKFLTNGVDPEDIMYLKKSYEMMLNEGLSNPQIGWINDTHWVDHPITNIPDPPAKRRRVETFSRPHKTGSARSEGYYKMDPREKARTKYHFHRSGVDAFNIAKLGTKEQQKPQKAISLSREARSENRRMLNALGEDCFDSNLLQFNTLKFRRKAMRFGKSAIHDWGLFAMEHIGADEMVIEYVGDVIRPVLADTRETRYEKQGIGSSYLFRIDLDYVVDATKCGNLARFINHSCEPNCYAKVIKIDGSSKIVIYSKQPIAIGEEITYDYKFPIEDEKIRCLCGSKACRKYLN